MNIYMVDECELASSFPKKVFLSLQGLIGDIYDQLVRSCEVSVQRADEFVKFAFLMKRGTCNDRFLSPKFIRSFSSFSGNERTRLGKMPVFHASESTRLE